MESEKKVAPARKRENCRRERGEKSEVEWGGWGGAGAGGGGGWSGMDGRAGAWRRDMPLWGMGEERV